MKAPVKYVRLRPALLLTAATGLVALAAPARAQGDADFASRAALFRYDAAAPLNLTVVGSEKRGAVTVQDVTFTPTPGGTPVRAYLVAPDGPGPFAGVLWAHWLGDKKSDRSEFLDEAVELAGRGAVSLLVDGMWADPKWYGTRDPDDDYRSTISQVIAFRRAFDLLAARPGVDRDRLGFVGHDFGGMYGAIAAGVDPRAKAYVFVAVAPSLMNWAFFARQPKSKVDYIRQNAVFELSDYVARLGNAGVMGQFSNADPFIARYDASSFMAAAPKNSVTKFYSATHAMEGDAIRADRVGWLIDQLKLAK